MHISLHIDFLHWEPCATSWIWLCSDFDLTGNETKLGMSKGIAEPKLTAADAMLDKLTTAIFIFQIVVVLILGIAGNIWNNYEKDKVCTNGNGIVLI